MNKVSISSAVCADKGLKRSGNEDNFYLDGAFLSPKNRNKHTSVVWEPGNEMCVFGIFDGMGGESFGEEASMIAAKSLKKHHEMLSEGACRSIKEMIDETVAESGAEIRKLIRDRGIRRSGTTLASLIIDEDTATSINAGDSRVYLFRRGKLTRLSSDDTVTGRLAHMGVLQEEENGRSSKESHRLTQYIGMPCDEESFVEPHVSEKTVIEKGDVFLLCSDGLTDMVDERTIASILKKSRDCEEASEKLVQTALDNGGVDNVTVITVCADAKPRSRRRSIALIIALILLLGIIAGVSCLSSKAAGKPPRAIRVCTSDETVSADARAGSPR